MQKKSKLTFEDLRDAIKTEQFAYLEKNRIARELIQEGDKVSWLHGGATRSGVVIWNGGTRLRVSANSKRGYQFVGIERITGLTPPTEGEQK